MRNTFLIVMTIAGVLIGEAKISFAGLNEESSTFRCKQGLVSLNDSFHDVREKCGEPQSHAPGMWIYDYGAYSFVYMIKFSGGRVYKIINTGNYGTNQKP